MKTLHLMILATLLTMGCTQNKPAVKKLSKIESLQAEIEKAPSFDSYVELGLAYEAEKKLAESYLAYTRAAKINPKAPVAWNNICSNLNQQARYVEAKLNCKRALSLEPKFELAKNNLAFAEAKIKELRQNLATVKSNLKAIDKPSAQQYIDFGMSYFSMEELELSIKTWSKVSSTDPLYAVSLNNIATANILLRNFSAAEKALSAAINLDSKNELFQNNMAWLNSEKKQN